MVGESNLWEIRLNRVRGCWIFWLRTGCGRELLIGDRFWFRMFINFFRICLEVIIMFFLVICFFGILFWYLFILCLVYCFEGNLVLYRNLKLRVIRMVFFFIRDVISVIGADFFFFVGKVNLILFSFSRRFFFLFFDLVFLRILFNNEALRYLGVFNFRWILVIVILYLEVLFRRDRCLFIR